MLTSELYTMNNLNFPLLFGEQNGSVCPQVSLSSNFFFSVSLLCVTWFWVLCLFQSRYTHFTGVRKFHDSLTLNDFFFQSHHKLSWRLANVTLQGPPALSCFRHLHFTNELGFSDTACDSCCENLLLMQKKKKKKKKSKPRILYKSFSSLLFSAVSSTNIQTL